VPTDGLTTGERGARRHLIKVVKTSSGAEADRRTPSSITLGEVFRHSATDMVKEEADGKATVVRGAPRSYTEICLADAGDPWRSGGVNYDLLSIRPQPSGGVSLEAQNDDGRARAYGRRSVAVLPITWMAGAGRMAT